ncbi:GNAT family N-acetyltransferase [Paenibacillus methanolicus]|uniref:Acetyltransferase (GNAT) family protein n=1 Tax=Paenibacillus methanolicus TaxID=582686 RepID=A0A5S5CMA8_9BACL|nr:GNAT family N-acetyltransferase [Paenibacillus methanolicus]TYP79518.1 acetyltransferase (GNAT) family protein [Paenibacillus methanolicus]
MEFRPLHAFTLEQLTSLWNEGFQHYYVNLNFTLDMFLKRTATEGLSLAHSLAIMDGERPVGFVMNGFRQESGRKIAWNGGTALIPEYRGRGIGKLLIDEALRMYRAENVDVALLEAIKENASAIALYRKCGYAVIDTLAFYQWEGQIGEDAFGDPDRSNRYTFTVGNPQDVRRLSFHEEPQPWQSQWQSLQLGGLAIIASDPDGEPAGYALLKRVLDEQGVHRSTILYQCAAKADAPDRSSLMRALLSRTFASAQPIICRTGNFPLSQCEVVEMLERASFKSTLEQVHMKLVLQE